MFLVSTRFLHLCIILLMPRTLRGRLSLRMALLFALFLTCCSRIQPRLFRAMPLLNVWLGFIEAQLIAQGCRKPCRGPCLRLSPTPRHLAKI